MQQWSKHNNVTITGTSFYPALFLFLREHPYFFVDIKFKDQWMEKFQMWVQMKRLPVTQYNVDEIFEKFLKDNQYLLSTQLPLLSKTRKDGVSTNQTLNEGVWSSNQTMNVITNLTELFIQSPTPPVSYTHLTLPTILLV